MDNKVRIEAEFDLEALKASIADVKDIDKAEDFFAQLSEVQRVKTEINDVLDLLKSVEAEAKGLINSKAKALFGDEWKAIKGHGFKITRSHTGAVFNITGQPNAKFYDTKKVVKSDEVKEYIVAHDGKLPSGIEYNPSRGESISIKVDGNA